MSADSSYGAVVVASGDDHCVKTLLQAGADVDLADKEGISPLHYASLSCSEENVNLMLQYEAHVNTFDKTNGSSPLHDACFAGSLTCVKALVEAGATDISGPTFAIADDTAITEQARNAAVARGAAQARAYAAMLGYSDIRVLAVAENIEGSLPISAAAKTVALEATSTPIQPGQVSTGVNVTITYELVGKSAAGTK